MNNPTERALHWIATHAKPHIIRDYRPEDEARDIMRALMQELSAAPLQADADAFHEVMGCLRAMQMEHGTCQPRERKACTTCNARDTLGTIIAAYRGPRVIRADAATAQAKQE